MRLYQSIFAFLALSISCNEKEEEVKPVENCRFVGRSVNLEQKTTAETSVATYESSSKQDDQGRLTLVTVSQTESRKDSTGIFASTTEEETNEFKYDAAGFLIELKRHNLQLQKGAANYEFSYANLRYRTRRVETTTAMTYVYKEGSFANCLFTIK